MKKREEAIKNGEAAINLKDLRTIEGLSFKEIKEPQWDVFSSVCKLFRIARAVGTTRKIQEILPKNQAYFCPYGCNWVRGSPGVAEYNERGMLAGSAGTKYSCRICGALLGIDEAMCS
jgi:hypothetical protein